MTHLHNLSHVCVTIIMVLIQHSILVC